jgi:hypothetical protein
MTHLMNATWDFVLPHVLRYSTKLHFQGSAGTKMEKQNTQMSESTATVTGELVFLSSVFVMKWLEVNQVWIVQKGFYEGTETCQRDCVCVWVRVGMCVCMSTFVGMCVCAHVVGGCVHSCGGRVWVHVGMCVLGVHLCVCVGAHRHASRNQYEEKIRNAAWINL